jgi:hypothetical protein
MYWALLMLLFIITLPINTLLLGRVWYKWYPIDIYRVEGEAVDQSTIMKAQGRAILLFGLAQPILASVPLLFGNHWWQYIICAVSTTGFSASGSARFFLDRVRSSYLMRLGTLVSFAIGAVMFTLLR